MKWCLSTTPAFTSFLFTHYLGLPLLFLPVDIFVHLTGQDNRRRVCKLNVMLESKKVLNVSLPGDSLLFLPGEQLNYLLREKRAIIHVYLAQKIHAQM